MLPRYNLYRYYSFGIALKSINYYGRCSILSQGGTPLDHINNASENHHLVPVPDGDGGHCASDEASPYRSDPHEKALFRETLGRRYRRSGRVRKNRREGRIHTKW